MAGGSGFTNVFRRTSQYAEMWFGLRPIVEAEHSRDDGRVFGGHADGANAAAEISAGMAVLLEFDVEGSLKVANGS